MTAVSSSSSSPLNDARHASYANEKCRTTQRTALPHIPTSDPLLPLKIHMNTAGAGGNLVELVVGALVSFVAAEVEEGSSAAWLLQLCVGGGSTPQ